ncbi:MAG: hypothetical protein ACLFXM_07670 [Acidimicrobiia bacterium]
MAATGSDAGGGELLIAGRIHARLLGLGLLTLDARVTVGPLGGSGALPVSGRLHPTRRRRFRGRRRLGSRAVPTGGGRRRRVAPPGPAMNGGREDGRQPVGDGLARSEDLVGQATALLAEVSDR